MPRMLLFWTFVFVVALAVLVKGADWLVTSAERIGLRAGLSPFIVGVTIVAVGTSFPEITASFAAVLKGVPDVVVANVVGSNIANILLIVGFAALAARRLVVTKSLIDLDLPLLAIGTVLFIGVLWDKTVTFGESVLLVATYGIYVLYTVLHREEVTNEDAELMPTRAERREALVARDEETGEVVQLGTKDFVLLIAGVAGLALGAKYLIDALVQLSQMLNIATGVIAITAVAVGTSLPELIVSVKAAMQRKSEVALGNIFGSNIFNALMVVGLPGLFYTLPVDDQTYLLGIPYMAAATFLFIISGISRRIHLWEGTLFLVVYILFTAKLFEWF